MKVLTEGNMRSNIKNSKEDVKRPMNPPPCPKDKELRRPKFSDYEQNIKFYNEDCPNLVKYTIDLQIYCDHLEEKIKHLLKKEEKKK